MVTFAQSTRKALSAGLLSAAVAVTAACTTVESQSFVVNEQGNVDAAFVAVDADFSRYDRLMAEPMGIFFPGHAATTVEDQQRIRQIFRTAFLAELEGYDIVSTAGPTTMKVEASLIDFRGSTSADTMSVRRELRDFARPGTIMFLMEMRDSETDRVLARASDSAKTPTISTGDDAQTDWSSVEDAAAHWASLFRQFLDQNLKQ